LLGEPSSIRHHRTDRGEFLFRIEVVGKLPVPVRADIFYINAKTGEEERDLQSDFFFDTTTLWVLREKSPFPDFKVAARIVHGNEATIGPFYNSSEVIGKAWSMVMVGTCILVHVSLSNLSHRPSGCGSNHPSFYFTFSLQRSE